MPAMHHTNDTSNDVKPYSYKKRPYAQACLPCKARKIRCVDADNPPCRACKTAAIECEFPTRAGRPRRSHAAASTAGSTNGTAAAAHAPGSSNGETDPEARAFLERRLRRIENALNLAPLTAAPGSDGSEEEMEPPRFTLGTDERPVYHGETSMHDDAPSLDPSPRTSAASQQVLNDAHTAYNEAEVRRLTRMKHKYASPDEGESMIDAYFCWASPSTAVVIRNTFLRDMAYHGPYFSDLLLLVVYLSGARFSPHLDQREREARQARYMGIIMSMIAEELCKPSSIVNAQALLSLAGTRCAQGEHTQAWFFTGLGIRMIQDLGIHLAIEDPNLDEALEQEEREMRVKLYWSAYCWDKTLSLGMGREPALTCRPNSVPKVTLSDSADEAWEWRPYFPGGGHLRLVLAYPHTMARTTFVLRYYTELHMILESILVNMYSPHRPHARSVAFIRSADEKLSQWRADLPRSIKLETGNLPEFCPPVNVVIVNLLYHCMKVLLYRPLLTVRNQPSGITSSSLDVCRTAAIDINEIVTLWCNTYGNVNMIYLLMYSTYLAAGVDVILLKIGDHHTQEEALKRVQLGLTFLEHAAGQGPGIRRGIQIIASQLEAAMQRHINGTVALGAQPIPPYAESSLRHEASDSRSTSTGPQTNGHTQHHTSMPPPAFGNHHNAQGGVQGGVLFDYTGGAVGAGSPALFDDPQALANLLGESNVGTDDPFAFLTGEGWDDLTR